jgi:hypothetical protein
VNLSGPNGSFVTLVPVAYEFPNHNAGAIECDWLVIELSAATAEGNWSSRDACLTTGDAPGISKWLRSVADGCVPISVPEADADITPDLTF